MPKVASAVSDKATDLYERKVVPLRAAPDGKRLGADSDVRGGGIVVQQVAWAHWYFDLRHGLLHHLLSMDSQVDG